MQTAGHHAILSALVGLCVCSATSWAQALDQRFGVVVFTQEWRAQAIPKTKALGTGLIRAAGCDWKDIEPSRGVFNWAGCADDWVNGALNNGFRLYFTTGCTPAWANGGLGCNVAPADINDWYLFVQNFVSRYSYARANLVMGIYNEPNLPAPDRSGPLSYLDYCQLVRTASDARNSVNPAFVLGAPETSHHAVLDTYYRDVMTCIGTAMAAQDVVAVHWYRDGPAMLEYMDTIGNSAGDREVWLTETGLATADLVAQATFYDSLIDTFVNSARPWWTHIVFYRLWDGSDCCSESILRANYSNKSAFNAYHNWLLGLSGAGSYNTLLPGWRLYPGQSVFSADGRFQLIYQLDGNLVLYQVGIGALRASNTVGISPGRTEMQIDGNLVIYDRAGNPIRSTGTPIGNFRSYLIVQDDGNAVIYRFNGVYVWDSRTCCR